MLKAQQKLQTPPKFDTGNVIDMTEGRRNLFNRIGRHLIFLKLDFPFAHRPPNAVDARSSRLGGKLKRFTSVERVVKSRRSSLGAHAQVQATILRMTGARHDVVERTESP